MRKRLPSQNEREPTSIRRAWFIDRSVSCIIDVGDVFNESLESFRLDRILLARPNPCGETSGKVKSELNSFPFKNRFLVEQNPGNFR